VGGTLKLAYPCYTYGGVEPGFAEHDLDEYDKIAERLAWTRSLGVVRKGLRMDVDDALERIREETVECMLVFIFSCVWASIGKTNMVQTPSSNAIQKR